MIPPLMQITRSNPSSLSSGQDYCSCWPQCKDRAPPTPTCITIIYQVMPPSSPLQMPTFLLNSGSDLRTGHSNLESACLTSHSPGSSCHFRLAFRYQACGCDCGFPHLPCVNHCSLDEGHTSNVGVDVVHHSFTQQMFIWEKIPQLDWPPFLFTSFHLCLNLSNLLFSFPSFSLCVCLFWFPTTTLSWPHLQFQCLSLYLQSSCSSQSAHRVLLC